LKALENQTLPCDEWELLLVDNASVPTLSERQLALPANCILIEESKLGLTAARVAGFRAARAPLVVLIDDDTIPAPDYLANSLALMQAHPEIGAAGGRIRGEFGEQPKQWMNGYLDLLALRDFGDRPIRALIHNEIGPWEPCGAGMVLRLEVAHAYATKTVETMRLRLDRVGTSLSSCGDTDLARTASDLGLYLAYEPSLMLTHLIPAGRLKLGYLMRLTFCIQRDAWLLYRLRGKRCSITGWRMWVRWLLVPLRSLSADPRRWLLKASSSYGQLRGRSIELNPSP
jgi:glycosyltransferase involved in cell wall biosynthesis